MSSPNPSPAGTSQTGGAVFAAFSKPTNAVSQWSHHVSRDLYLYLYNHFDLCKSVSWLHSQDLLRLSFAIGIANHFNHLNSNLDPVLKACRWRGRYLQYDMFRLSLLLSGAGDGVSLVISLFTSRWTRMFQQFSPFPPFFQQPLKFLLLFGQVFLFQKGKASKHTSRKSSKEQQTQNTATSKQKVKTTWRWNYDKNRPRQVYELDFMCILVFVMYEIISVCVSLIHIYLYINFIMFTDMDMYKLSMARSQNRHEPPASRSFSFFHDSSSFLMACQVDVLGKLK